jgi:hypothetical protein
VILVSVLIVVAGLIRGSTPAAKPTPSGTTPVQTTTPNTTLPSGLILPPTPTQPQATQPQATQPGVDVEPSQNTQPSQNDGEAGNNKPSDAVVPLGEGLTMTYLGKYAGIFMEDGTDEAVSNVIMMILRNDSDRDLQLARIALAFSNGTANFQVTNLPAGASVVLLESNRMTFTGSNYSSVQVSNVVHFSEPMTLMDDRFEITGGNGYLDIKNISGQDISDEVFIYYKNSASDLLYGGITYRARATGGIKAGETLRITAGHYSEGSSRLVMVTCNG